MKKFVTLFSLLFYQGVTKEDVEKAGASLQAASNDDSIAWSS